MQLKFIVIETEEQRQKYLPYDSKLRIGDHLWLGEENTPIPVSRDLLRVTGKLLMTEIDQIEYASAQGKILRLQDKISGWEREAATICHIIRLLKASLQDTLDQEKEIQNKYGVQASRQTNGA